MRKKLTEIWSSYPPPYGGVSVHSMRLFENLRKDRDIKIIFKNFHGKLHDPGHGIMKVNSFFQEFIKLFYVRKKNIHLHTNNRKVWILFGIIIRRHNIIITLHNQQIKKVSGRIWILLLRIFFRRVKYIIFNESRLIEYLTEIYQVDKKKLVLLPAFIPPLKSEHKALPVYITDFIMAHKKNLSTSAWKVKLHGGIDIYGLDQILKAFHMVSQNYPSIGLIILVPIISDHRYFESLLAFIDNNSLSDKVLIIRENIENAFDIWAKTDVYIRATSTDIEGLTIKETLYFNKKVVASDVVERAEGSILYRYNDVTDLYKKIMYALNESEVSNLKKDNNTVVQIADLYKSL